jgi:hypothetical protein
VTRVIKPGARALAEAQDAAFMNEGTEPAVFFEFDDMTIHNPWADEMGANAVDPVAYYGEAFLASGFCEDA